MDPSELARRLTFQRNRRGIGVLLSDMQGYLHKRGGVVKNWKRRWFMLQDDYLLYFEDERKDALKACIHAHVFVHAPYAHALFAC